MLYGKVPGINKKISRLVQGTVMLSTGDEPHGWALMDEIFSLGCTTFDTAHIYAGGDNERIFGRWMNDRGIREKLVIIGKGAHHSPDRKRVTAWDITADIYDSLARLKTDYIDLYLLHRDDPDMPVDTIVETLHAHKVAGRIHAYGGSNWSANRIAEANAYAKEHNLSPFVASSPHFSLAVQIRPPWDDCVSITGQNNIEQQQWYSAEKMPLFCWSSLAGGWFSGKLNRDNKAEHEESLYMYSYGSEDNFKRLDRAGIIAREKNVSIAQIALAWVLNHPELNLFPLVAAYSKEEFEQCITALQIKLTPKECAWLNLED